MEGQHADDLAALAGPGRRTQWRSPLLQPSPALTTTLLRRPFRPFTDHFIVRNSYGANGKNLCVAWRPNPPFDSGAAPYRIKK